VDISTQRKKRRYIGQARIDEAMQDYRKISKYVHFGCDKCVRGCTIDCLRMRSKKMKALLDGSGDGSDDGSDVSIVKTTKMAAEVDDELTETDDDEDDVIIVKFWDRWKDDQDNQDDQEMTTKVSGDKNVIDPSTVKFWSRLM
jgi:Na+-translocating ferredoxin:NAD+ oxidoreductase RNF subunit RnfB